jgi:PPK2 family polyphosphate:nucleotide phosphotransferase
VSDGDAPKPTGSKKPRPPRPEVDLEAFAETLRVAPGTRPDLAAIDPAGSPGFEGGKREARREMKKLRGSLFSFQNRLWAERKRSMLIVLQAMDAGGKDGTIRKVFGAFDPQGTEVASFGVPTEEELAHDFLWRIHAHAPHDGRIGIFNRSHYEDVLVVRVAGLAPESVWRPRYQAIAEWERGLVAEGTTILKFMLHISREEQRKRFQKRVDRKSKRWKFSEGDLAVRQQWGDYLDAYAEALERTSTAGAPWFVIPADRKWYRDLAVARITAAAAKRIDPKYPERPDLEGFQVPE